MNDILDSVQGTTWYYRTNGDKITVREVIFDMDGSMQYIIDTGNGGRKTIDASVLNDYIQSDKPLNLPKRMPPPQKIKIDDIEEKPNDGSYQANFSGTAQKIMLDGLEDTDFPYTNFRDSAPTRFEGMGVEPKMPLSEFKIDVPNPTPASNRSIIERALKKTSMPTIENKYVWANYPQKEIEMLIDILDVPQDDIIEYLTSDEFIDKCIGDIRKELKDFIKCKICVESTRNIPIEVPSEVADAHKIDVPKVIALPNTSITIQQLQINLDQVSCDVQQKPIL